MTLVNPSATALRSFFHRLHVREGNVGKVIAESFNIKEHSKEFYALIHHQVNNFNRLDSQVDLAPFGNAAKQQFKSQLSKLATITRYDVFHQKFQTFYTDVITPNLVVLTYLDDAIRVTPALTDVEIKNLREIATELQGILEEALASNLPIQVIGYLREQITNLIFALSNYESIGADELAETASTVLLTIQTRTELVNTPEQKIALGRLGRALIHVVAYTTIVTHGLTAFDDGLDRMARIGAKVKSAYEWVETWNPLPQIEDQSRRRLPSDQEDT